MLSIIIITIVAKEMPGLKPDLKQMLHFVRNSGRPSWHSILCVTFSLSVRYFSSYTFCYSVTFCFNVTFSWSVTFCKELLLPIFPKVCNQCFKFCDSVSICNNVTLCHSLTVCDKNVTFCQKFGSDLHLIPILLTSHQVCSCVKPWFVSVVANVQKPLK